jgi:hypothetical protein
MPLEISKSGRNPSSVTMTDLAALATLIFGVQAHLLGGHRDFSSKCPTRFGNCWSSMCTAAAAAHSNSSTARATLGELPKPISASALTGKSTALTIRAVRSMTPLRRSSSISGYPAPRALLLHLHRQPEGSPVPRGGLKVHQRRLAQLKAGNSSAGNEVW